ncbi:MAG: response regulator [Alphaproteobacteria bacterium PRO2]|nr:response regulator [Alphaproteobacteria bacterium PRO2]
MEQVTPNPADILVVDDSEIMRHMIAEILKNSEILKKDDAPVATASSGEDALAKIANRKFKVVVTDNNMPGMSGVELTEAIRQQLHDQETIIIGTSVNREAWIAAAFKNAGANRFISKEEAHMLPEMIAELAT